MQLKIGARKTRQRLTGKLNSSVFFKEKFKAGGIPSNDVGEGKSFIWVIEYDSNRGNDLK